jgi:putative membrane protein
VRCNMPSPPMVRGVVQRRCGSSAAFWRLFAGTEKATSYYMHNDAFLLKMALLALILALEIWPMLTLIRWRVARGKGTLDLAAHTSVARRIAMISVVQALLVAAMVMLAVAMARGYGTTLRTVG